MVVSVGAKVKFKGDLGVVRYAGETHFAPGVWVGVELLDQPNGKNDGSVNGERYFQCEDKYGIFVREHLVDVLEARPLSPIKVNKTRASLPNDPTHRKTSSSSTRLSSAMSSRTPSRASEGGSNDSNSESLRLRNIIQKLQDKLQVMKSDLDILRSQLHLVEAKNIELEDTINKNKEDFEISAVDRETLEEQNVLLKEEIESLREQNSKIREQIKSLDKEAKSSNNPKHQDLLNESKESLIERNSMLEDALVKLRDYSNNQKTTLQRKIDELESTLDPLMDIEEKYEETSIKLIDAETTISDLKLHIETSIHSTEIIDTLTNENNSLTEENEKLKSTIQELEELRRVGEELESFHIENTSNLQKEIDQLKENFEKQTIGVQDLQESQEELKAKTIELEKINEALKQTTNGSSVKSKESNNNSNTNDLNKKAIQLKNDLLLAELEYRKQYIIFIEDTYGKSDTTTHQNEVLRLKSYVETYKLLAQYPNTESSDLFVNVLGIKLKYQLLLFAEDLELLASIHQYAQSFTSLDLEELSSKTESLIELVKEQAFRGLPNFKELRDSLFNQLSNVTSSFSNYFQGKCEIKQELETVNTILNVLGLINDDEISRRFSIPKGSLSKLYQVNNTRKQKLETSLERLQMQEGEDLKEITKIEIISFQDQLEGFLKHLSQLLATNTSDSLHQKIDTLLEFTTNHVDDLLNWEWEQPDKQTWVLKEVKTKLIDTKEMSSLQLDLSNAQELGSKKDKQIEELTLKINVLSSRLNISKDTESQLRKLKNEVSNLNELNEELNGKVFNLTESNEKMSKDLQKAKTNSLLYNSQFESLYEQKQYTDRAELVSELHDLRNVVKLLTKRKQKQENRNWLRIEFPKFNPYEKTQADELRNIGKDLQRAVNNAKLYSITDGAK
ncbi:Dynactin subunit 1 [Wickerhamomyces ciferrii]|uniref:Dynactin subunit 1 n=1 Tax=Wickerhamomyces ciferrii (strain ATCC 14091 / BCRC 22168 / CBS 111 / JCM 3599 / NBRC 0793 / NRRL Y-1031 F-60-10) TaxID=1206466 RepID=K0KCX4_WICCF|nr:Dynactin subunit 1 [Wickerhamomyces ciferrii]CCH42955.1 Dynactin subunit 1 [Wickerhamomyces ciferrii]